MRLASLSAGFSENLRFRREDPHASTLRCHRPDPASAPVLGLGKKFSDPGTARRSGRTEHNKPYFPTLPGLHVNWSHGGPFVLCALGNAPVGADIEVIPPPHRFPPPLRTDGLRVCPVSGRRRRLARFLRPLDEKAKPGANTPARACGASRARTSRQTGCFSAPTKPPPGGPPCAGRKYRPPPSNGRRKHHEALQTIL